MSATEPPVIEAGWALYTAEHEALRMRVRTWVAEHITPHVGRWEEAGDFPRALYAAAGAAGLFGHKVGPVCGGSGPDFLADAVVTEELAACGSGGVAAGLGAHKDLGMYYLWRFGSGEHHRRYVAPAVRGEVVTALAVTEPGAGSDVAGLRTRARQQPGGDWLLHGTKTFITNGTRADVIVVAAVTDPDAGGHHGMTLFAVEASDTGLARTRIPTLGWRTSHTAELAFTDVRLPADRVVGGPGGGFVCIMRNFQWERIGMALGAVRGAEETMRRAAARGAPLAEELADDVAAARSLTHHALRRFVHGEDAVRETSMSKALACALAVRVAEAALVAASAAGGSDTDIEQRVLRDARLGPIGGGTTQIMREVIGRGYGL